MFCKNCGKQVNEEALFCKACGKKIEYKDNKLLDGKDIVCEENNKVEAKQEFRTEVIEEEVEQETTNTEVKIKKNKMIIVFLIIIVVSVFLVLAFLFLKNGNKNLTLGIGLNNKKIGEEDHKEKSEPIDDSNYEDAELGIIEPESNNGMEVKYEESEEDEEWDYLVVSDERSPEEPYYGIFIAETDSLEVAENESVKATKMGYEGRVFLTSEWENINSDFAYVITVGTFESEENAELCIESVRNTYKDAYIMYSGNFVSSKDEVDSESEEANYVFKDSDERYLTEEDLLALTDDELRIARNEIVARHGRKFLDSSLQDYFNSKDWYEGTIEAGDFLEAEYLNEYELANMYFISDYEAKNKN